MLEKIINFDMDGTIANLYGVENWLDDILALDPRPYREAKPLLNMQVLARILNRLQKQGYQINIISWLAGGSTPEYDEAVKMEKIKWLHKHLKSVVFDNVYIVPYGTPKHKITTGILFDDDLKNRELWGEGAFDVDNIIEVLKAVA